MKTTQHPAPAIKTPQIAPRLTREQFVEYQYRFTERIGILCGSDEPTEEQVELAKREAMTDTLKIKNL